MADKLKNTSDATFQRDVLEASQNTTVLVDFWATWCQPCKALAPHLESIESELSGKLAVVKLDVDNNQQVAIQYGVVNVPVLLLFKGGKVVDKLVGNPGSKGKIQSFVKPHVS